MSWVVVCGAPVAAAWMLHRSTTEVTRELAVTFATVGMIAAICCVVLGYELVRVQRGSRHLHITRWRKPFALIAASVVAPHVAASPWPPGSTAVVKDLSMSMSPAMAGAALAVILERRQSSVLSLSRPRRLTDREFEMLSELRRRAHHYESAPESADVERPDLIVEIDPRIERLLDSVTEGAEGSNATCQGDRTEWSGLVRVMGYPEVVDASGHQALFRKGKSLELLVWLCFNRDRMRRSAARTALWDVEISDATFATVVSEMRRALRELLPCGTSGEVSRPTYTDAIDLTADVVTDFDVLLAAHSEFRAGGSPQDLAVALRGVRDVPFAGANYAWADYDGTTTRIVITVIEASVELAQWALAEGDSDLASVALTAGLRTMPEHPDLLEVQSRLRQRRVLGV